MLDGVRTGLPGGGAFYYYRPELVLTSPKGHKSRWAVPEWLMPSEDRTALSYHKAPERWSYTEAGEPRLQTVAKGHEFVFDAAGLPEVQAWI